MTGPGIDGLNDLSKLREGEGKRSGAREGGRGREREVGRD